VPGGHRFATVSAGGVFSLAITNGNVGYAWGLNVWGMLGNGTTTPSSAPVQISPLP
jgi:alpha-tubulin suppressor-like RCC1 family protein